MPVRRSATRRATRKDAGFATSCALIADLRTQRVVMPGRRDAWHVLFNSLLAWSNGVGDGGGDPYPEPR